MFDKQEYVFGMVIVFAVGVLFGAGWGIAFTKMWGL